MEEEAIITAVRLGPRTTTNEGQDIEFLDVSFRVLRRFKYQDKECMVTFKNAAWLSDLQPRDGYQMEHGEFTASLPKDGRITEGLKVILDVTDA